jgi:membrane associated rhomboid family serine protease
MDDNPANPSDEHLPDIGCSTAARSAGKMRRMEETWSIVYESRHRRRCTERSLVLDSLDIPHEVLQGEAGWAIAVPASDTEAARRELAQYARENLVASPGGPVRLPVYQDALPGIIGYFVILLVVAWAAGTSLFGRDWVAAGRVDGELLRQGELWRLVTAQTLHGSLKHLLGNLGFGALFGLFAGRLLGSGVAWLVIVLAACLANELNVLLLDNSHRSIGASTAVFAALGVVAAYVWSSNFMSQDRWPYRVGPLVGGLALLAFTGTGDANTDIGAHLMGFVFGFAAGAALAHSRLPLDQARLQRGAAVLAIALVISAWGLAFSVAG